MNVIKLSSLLSLLCIMHHNHASQPNLTKTKPTFKPDYDLFFIEGVHDEEPISIVAGSRISPTASTGSKKTTPALTNSPSNSLVNFKTTRAVTAMLTLSPNGSFGAPNR